MQSRSFFFRYKLHHVLFWAVVFGVWYYLRFQDYRTTPIALKVTLLKVADLALMVYLTNYLLIPKLLYKKRYVWFTLAFISLILASSFGKMYLIGQIMERPDWFSFTRANIKGRFYDNVIPHFFLVIAGAAFKLMMDHSRVQRRLVEMAKEKSEAELNFLKSQINPHFLFNSLNSVYFLIDKNNAEARNALHKFSDMLRYQLYEMNGDRIPVEKEVRYLKDYVDLQKLRKDENYSVEFHCSPSVQGFSIEPLLLIPFVENAFKHISHHKDNSNFVKLELSRSNGEFRFEIENSRELLEKTTEQHGGIGLNNVRRRLELLYPEKHELEIKNTGKSFKVKLSIEI
jgi:two-component system, LytTR family, sensor kinase